MQYRRVGHSGLEVSAIALGTMTFGTRVDAIDAQDLLTAFIDAGGTLLDTAPVYGDGGAERLVGELLGKLGLRDHMVIAGKAGIGYRRGEVVRDSSRRTLLDQLHGSLRDLDTDFLDLWQIHRWDQNTPLEETLAVLDHAVQSGKVRYVGISNFRAWQTALAHSWLSQHSIHSRLVSAQVEYSLMNREIENELAPALEHLGMSTLAWSPLGRGVLTGKYRGGIPHDSRGADSRYEAFVSNYLTPERAGVVEALARAADGLNITMSQAALAWLRDRPTVASVIIGARNADHATDCLSAADLVLPAEITSALNDVSSPHGWQPQRTS